MAKTERERYVKRWGALKNERETWLDHWRDISDHITPRRARFLCEDVNQGGKRNQKIIDSEATLARRTLASGMMAGITSPARRWFRLTVADPDLARRANVLDWLGQVEDRMFEAFALSNIYKCLHQMYGDLGTFGTVACHIDEDTDRVLRGYVWPIGQYCLAQSDREQVDSVYRKFPMTVGAIVKKFGLAACSERLRLEYKSGDVDRRHPVLHIVEPNDLYEPGKLGPKGFRYRSVWLEFDAQDKKAEFLRDRGYIDFPTLCPRWSTVSGDVYGSDCPGMDALADIRSLQLLAGDKLLAFQKATNPAMVGPEGMKDMDLRPGGQNWEPAGATGGRMRAAHEIVPGQLTEFRNQGMEFKEIIRRHFYADLWLALSSGSDVQKTAREVAERHDEKMSQLGPVLDQLQDEELDPLIHRTFSLMALNGQIPPMPEELAGASYKVEYISIMAQAQRMLGIASIERVVNFTSVLGSAKAAVQGPSVWDNFDTDKIAREYATAAGLKPDMMTPEDRRDAERQARARQIQRQEQAAAAMAATQGAKNLAQSPLDGTNALSALLPTLGAAAPAAPGAVQ